MKHIERKYYVLKAQASGEVVGIVTFIAPSIDSSVYNFSLHRPEYMHKEAEFMDLNYTEIPYAEFETHLDVFESAQEVEVVSIRETTTTTTVLVRKKTDDVGERKEVPTP